MDDATWARFCELHELNAGLPFHQTNSGAVGPPKRTPRTAGEPAFRKSAVCCVCSWVGAAEEAAQHRDATHHPVVWPTHQRPTP